MQFKCGILILAITFSQASFGRATASFAKNSSPAQQCMKAVEAGNRMCFDIADKVSATGAASAMTAIGRIKGSASNELGSIMKGLSSLGQGTNVTGGNLCADALELCTTVCKRSAAQLPQMRPVSYSQTNIMNEIRENVEEGKRAEQAALSCNAAFAPRISSFAADASDNVRTGISGTDVHNAAVNNLPSAGEAPLPTAEAVPMGTMDTPAQAVELPADVPSSPPAAAAETTPSGVAEAPAGVSSDGAGGLPEEQTPQSGYGTRNGDEPAPWTGKEVQKGDDGGGGMFSGLGKFFEENKGMLMGGALIGGVAALLGGKKDDKNDSANGGAGGTNQQINCFGADAANYTQCDAQLKLECTNVVNLGGDKCKSFSNRHCGFTQTTNGNEQINKAEGVGTQLCQDALSVQFCQNKTERAGCYSCRSLADRGSKTCLQNPSACSIVPSDNEMAQYKFSCPEDPVFTLPKWAHIQASDKFNQAYLANKDPRKLASILPAAKPIKIKANDVATNSAGSILKQSSGSIQRLCDQGLVNNCGARSGINN